MRRVKERKKISLFGFAVTLLSLLLIGLTAYAVTKSAPQKSGYRSEPSMILGELNRGRYAEAVQNVAENRAIGADEKTDEAYAAPYAVCDYFEAYSYYNACTRVKDAGGAAFWEAEMNEAYARMGSLQIMAEEIRNALSK